MLQITTNSTEETYNFGYRLAALLKPGDVICLNGTLGAGKTLFVQGIAAGLGYPDEAVSPTFTIMNVYRAKLPIYHFDLYRLDYPEQLADIGFEEYTSSDGVALIEWADKFPEAMPDDFLEIKITPEGACSRSIVLNASGPRYRQLIEELKS